MSDYILVGHLKNGEAIYAKGQGLIAIEKDNEFLVEPTEEESAEVYKLCGFLIPRHDNEPPMMGPSLG